MKIRFTFNKLQYESCVEFEDFYRGDELVQILSVTLLQSSAYLSTPPYEKDIKRENVLRHGSPTPWTQLISSNYATALEPISQFSRRLLEEQPLVELYYNAEERRLDVRHRNSKRCVAVAFQFGHPSCDFDDEWADKATS